MKEIKLVREDRSEGSRHGHVRHQLPKAETPPSVVYSSEYSIVNTIVLVVIRHRRLCSLQSTNEN